MNNLNNMNKVIKYSNLLLTPLKFKNIINNPIRSKNNYNIQIIKQSYFLKDELSIRLAKITKNIINLPYIITKNNSFNDILKLYMN